MAMELLQEGVDRAVLVSGVQRSLRPKKMEATCMIDHKWPYNENLFTPQSWGRLVLGRPPWRFRQVGLKQELDLGGLQA